MPRGIKFALCRFLEPDFPAVGVLEAEGDGICRVFGLHAAHGGLEPLSIIRMHSREKVVRAKGFDRVETQNLRRVGAALRRTREDVPCERLVDLAKLRWRIERDYQELKQEIGLGHYEGRRWRGFHHHATLCIAAYGFLILERETIPPSGPRSAARRQAPAVPEDYRPRGAADPTRAPHPKLNRHDASAIDRRNGQETHAMSLLRSQQWSVHTTPVMTQ